MDCSCLIDFLYSSSQISSPSKQRVEHLPHHRAATPQPSPRGSVHSPEARGIVSPLVVAHSDLVAALLYRLPQDAVELGCSMSGFREDKDGVLISFQVCRSVFKIYH